jgi:cytidine deaminase
MIQNEDKKKLIESAKSALFDCYPKGGEYLYSASVLTDKGNIYSAGSYGSFTASLTLHGEQCALVHASAHGEGNIMAIAVASNEKNEKGEFTAPCHMCQQLLWESRLRSNIPLLIILANEHDETKEIYIDELMTLAWPKRA